MKKREAGELTCGGCCGGSRWCSLVAVVPGGAAAVSFFFFPSLCRGTSLCFSSPSSSICSSPFHFLSFVLSLFLISCLSLYSFPVLFPCLSPFCLVSLLSSFSLSASVFFLFSGNSNPSTLFFFSSSFFFPPSLHLSPLVFIRRKRGREGYYSCTIMAQG